MVNTFVLDCKSMQSILLNDIRLKGQWFIDTKCPQ